VTSGVVAAEFAHQMGLAPLLGLALAAKAGVRPERSHVLFASALSLSWVTDSLSQLGGGAWWPAYVGGPAQMALALAAFRPFALVPAPFAFWSASLLIAVSWPGHGHDALLVVAGSILILMVAQRDLAPAAYLYFGLGTVLYLQFVMHASSGSFFWWKAFQEARGAGIVAFLVALDITVRRHPCLSS